MTTPDPTPALLSAARLAEIRAKLADHTQPHDFRSIAADLLAHFDALTPPLPDDGGEALGRRLRAVMHPPGDHRSSPIARLTRGALAIYQRGYAAGAVAMTGGGDDPGTEGAVLILMKRHDRELHAAHAAGRSEGEAERARATQEGIDIGRAQGWKEANVEIDRLVAARAGERASAAEAIEGQAAEIARLNDLHLAMVNETDRLTAELAAERALTEELRAMEAEALASADRWRAASERHERERDAMAAELARWCKVAGVTSPEALASLLRDNLRALDTARLGGAREEREACVGSVVALMRAGSPSWNNVVSAAVSVLRARGEGQGS